MTFNKIGTGSKGNTNADLLPLTSRRMAEKTNEQ
jgi:hypothetical protein